MKAAHGPELPLGRILRTTSPLLLLQFLYWTGLHEPLVVCTFNLVLIAGMFLWIPVVIKRNYPRRFSIVASVAIVLVIVALDAGIFVSALVPANFPLAKYDLLWRPCLDESNEMFAVKGWWLGEGAVSPLLWAGIWCSWVTLRSEPATRIEETDEFRSPTSSIETTSGENSLAVSRNSQRCPTLLQSIENSLYNFGLFLMQRGGRLATAALLLGGLGHRSQDYYTILHWVVCGVAAFTASGAFREKKHRRAWVLAIVALFFNPLVPVQLQRTTWEVVDLIAAGLLFASCWPFDKDMLPTQ